MRAIVIACAWFTVFIVFLSMLCVGAAGIAIDATRALTGVQVAYTATLPVVVVAATLFVAKAPQWRAGWCVAAGIAAYGGYVLYAVSCLPAV